MHEDVDMISTFSWVVTQHSMIHRTPMWMAPDGTWTVSGSTSLRHGLFEYGIHTPRRTDWNIPHHCRKMPSLPCTLNMHQYLSTIHRPALATLPNPMRKVRKWVSDGFWIWWPIILIEYIVDSLSCIKNDCRDNTGRGRAPYQVCYNHLY